VIAQFEPTKVDYRAAATDAPAALGLASIVGESPALLGAVELARRVAAARSTTVLLVGETGTGKELFARGIHSASPAAGEPFVAINCAAIPEQLLESELFGHEKGAFTGARDRKRGLVELAAGGTLFLDEIHHLPHRLQPKLLRVLESRLLRRLGALDEVLVGCRIIAATNVSLDAAVTRGEFREDLYYRLNVFRIAIPSLRERPQDIAVLAQHFLLKAAAEHGLAPRELSEEAVTALRKHSWPGNVRELKNVLERAAILCGTGPTIRPEHLLIQRRLARPAADLEAAGTAAGEIRIPADGRTLHEIELEAVRITMRLTRGNQSAAARILGISRPTLARKLREVALNGGHAANGDRVGYGVTP
jgi:transcriptional regulator with PAS, ATPase and Fis domain